MRDAETETLLRNIANPLFRAAGVDPRLVRIILLRDVGINSFVSTGNRMFIKTGRANLALVREAMALGDIPPTKILADMAENLLPAARES